MARDGPPNATLPGQLNLESHMEMRRLAAGMSIVLAQLALPGALAAQVAGGVEFFGTLDSSEPLTRTMGGPSLSVGTPFVGIRGSGSLGVSSVASGTSIDGPNDLIWGTDADLMLGPLNAGLGSGFMPYTFAGAGLMSAAYPTSFTDAISTWSYGGGVQLSLGRLLSVNGEVRSRHLAAAASYADSQLVRGLEYRIGIGFHFGGGGGRSPAYSRGRTGSKGRVDRSPPRAPRPRTRSRPTTWPIGNTAGMGAARRVVAEGERYVGVPYKWGGASPRTGFDCSGFVQYVYGSQGVDLPRTSRQMAGAGAGISTSSSAIAVGDLMLFAQNGKIKHVAMFAGVGMILHTSLSGGVD